MILKYIYLSLAGIGSSPYCSGRTELPYKLKQLRSTARFGHRVTLIWNRAGFLYKIKFLLSKKNKCGGQRAVSATIEWVE